MVNVINDHIDNAVLDQAQQSRRVIRSYTVYKQVSPKNNTLDLRKEGKDFTVKVLRRTLTKDMMMATWIVTKIILQTD